MRVRPPKFTFRVAVAMLGIVPIVIFARNVTLDSLIFDRVAHFQSLSIHVYGLGDCYMIATEPRELDNARDRGAPVNTWQCLPPAENQIWIDFVSEYASLDTGTPYRNPARPSWFGVRLIPWKNSTVVIVEPPKLRWFGLLLSIPLLTGLSRSAIRLRRKRRGKCMHCGYSLSGCPSPRCPECGEGFVPLTTGDAASQVETGAP
ncbi:MAG: hypothetical protein AMXMBFR47_08960 [Planctomycetota bacterium]